MISAWDCLYFAAVELVRSTPIKQRIVNAYRRYLSLMPIEQLPAEIRDSYAQILHSMHGVQPLRGEDEVADLSCAAGRGHCWLLGLIDEREPDAQYS